ncbi:TPA: DNA repair protein, partial [Klebsiella michiganensis]|nr:DNA repair protein [Klebsiella michiganensis]
CLKLATDAFGSPFVFDQPEDDLDNDFIMHSLVPLFRKIKQYRQVIIVTHNANLVVNCDAEQVIIATNNDEVISYRSGALEYGDHDAPNSMRKAICDVLEGGRQAFEAREQKYGMLWLKAI